jgi:L-ribulose-5-phosphate 3-epimerase
MRVLEPLEIGLMFWAKENARQTLQEVKSFGVSAGQLGIPGELNLNGKAQQWQSALSDENFLAVTAFCSYVGEDYTDIPTVKRTVGLVPEPTRTERVDRTKEVAGFAHEVGIKSIACHIGFVPHDRNHALYREIRNLTRDICDHCGRLEQSFTLETGQEPADILHQFIDEVQRSNLKINFDPANMILYGTGDPIKAFRALSKHVTSVHCKDGDWPPQDQPDALGTEKPLGRGSVNVPSFIATLKDVGYKGILSLEREELDQQQRAADIRSGITLLKQLTGRL